MNGADGALGDLTELGATHVGAAVIDRFGVLETSGDTEHVYELASVTKLFSAYATLVALEERTVALEDKAGPNSATLAHLLAHASGLSFDRPGAVLAPPGTRRIYSNVGFEALGAHVGDASGIEFTHYVTEAVFAPLGMQASTLTGAATNGRSSVVDLCAFAAELLHPSLVAPDTLAQATSTAFVGLDGVLPGYGYHAPCDWGLGFEIRAHKRPHWTGSRNTPQTYGHFGQSGSFIWVEPERGLALVLLSDLAFGEQARRRWPVISDHVVSRYAPMTNPRSS